MSNTQEIIAKLAEASDTQIDPKMIPRIKSAKTSDDFKGIINECAYEGLASTFMMNAMGAVYEILRKEEKPT